MDMFEHPHYAVVCCLVRTPQGVAGVSGAPPIAPAPLPPLGPHVRRQLHCCCSGLLCNVCSYSLPSRTDSNVKINLKIMTKCYIFSLFQKTAAVPWGGGAICVAHAPLLRIAAQRTTSARRGGQHYRYASASRHHRAWCCKPLDQAPARTAVYVFE